MSVTRPPWRVVIVDDQDDIRMLVRMQIDDQPRLEVVGEFADATDAIEAMTALQPDVIVLDHYLGGGPTGAETYAAIAAAAPSSRVVFHVGDPTQIDIPNAAEIVMKGADIVAAVLRVAQSGAQSPPD